MALGDFTEQAEAYSQSRPGYPSALLDRLIAHAGVSAGDPVADIGAGTGIFTELLASRGLTVTAIEPNAAMSAKGAARGTADWVCATFEETTLPDASQKWVATAQALHWAKLETALPEMRRILVRGGKLTALWNERDNEASPILMRTEEAISRHIPDFDRDYRRRDWNREMTSTGDFTQVDVDREVHHVRMSRQRYLNLWRSHNQLNNVAGPERFAKFLTEVDDYLKTENLDEFDVPYVCEAWTAS